MFKRNENLLVTFLKWEVTGPNCCCLSLFIFKVLSGWVSFCFFAFLSLLSVIIALPVGLGSNNRNWKNNICIQSRCCRLNWRSCIVVLCLGPLCLSHFFSMSSCISFPSGSDSLIIIIIIKTLFMHFAVHADLHYLCLSNTCAKWIFITMSQNPGTHWL